MYAAALPRLGYGGAIRIRDGSTRAAELVVVFLLDALGCLGDEQRRLLEQRVTLASMVREGLGLTIKPELALPADQRDVGRRGHRQPGSGGGIVVWTLGRASERSR